MILDDGIDEELGVNVVFDDSSDDGEGGVDEIREREPDDEMSEGEEAKMDYTIQEKAAEKSVKINGVHV